jgi:pimeloyl-ACP methyl ester carboxylesterase
MQPCEERKIQLPGFTIGLKVWNPQSTHRVLCLHGKLDNAASFDLLAPFLPHFQLVAVDFPGTGLSSPYPEGVLPHWKNDAFLMLQLINALNWEHFDLIAHSLGSLSALIMAIARPQQVNKLVFLDVLGPRIDFIEKGITYLLADIENFINHEREPKALFPYLDSAIQKRMKSGNISYQASQTLTLRGTTKTKEGYSWTFDRRLRSVASTLPYEDELRRMFNAIVAPVCLIRAKQGVPYPEKIFQERANAIKNLIIHELPGGHHIHMDDPKPVAKIISEFLKKY